MKAHRLARMGTQFLLLKRHPWRKEIAMVLYGTERDMESLTFSTDYRTNFLHIFVWYSAVVNADNWRILRGQMVDFMRTIGRFRADNWQILRGTIS